MSNFPLTIKCRSVFYHECAVEELRKHFFVKIWIEEINDAMSGQFYECREMRAYQ